MTFFALLYAAIAVLCLCLAVTLVRFVKGPTLPDRVMALDVFSANLIGILVIFSIISGTPANLSVALLFSLVTFVGSMSFAYYLLQKNK